MVIEEISIKNNKYPIQLRNIYDPPTKLYVLGNKDILNERSIAIVGSRNATKYGKSIAAKMAKELTDAGINIISGLALGIDTCAHLGSLQSEIGGKTIAILGNGLDMIYPAQNRDLARQIIKKGGCLISEYSLGTKPEKINFPKRNRLISGLSDGILIVEANKESGALITAEFGLEQGKEIYVIPGDINRKQSEGCNLLIKDGAQLVISSEEIIQEVLHNYKKREFDK